MIKINQKQTRETAAIAGNLMLAPMVAVMRMPMLALEAQSSNPFRTETLRAVTEKAAAVAEGCGRRAASCSRVR